MDIQRVALLGADGPVGAGLAEGLTARGVPVLRLSSLTDAPEGVGAVVDAGPLVAAPRVAELASLDQAAWRSQAEEPLRRALHVLQAAQRCLTGNGRFVVLLPSLVATGAAGVVAWAAAAEGYRSLAKAAARAWGRDGIIVNCLLLPADLVAGTSLDRPGLQPPALGRPVDIGSDLTEVVAALVTGDLAALTGQTIAVDGGVWMTP